MNEELQLFLEDAHEQLQTMENALLSIQEEGMDKERIDEIFRAMHTIKGMAGMFGFDGVVECTHIAENVMESVRNGEFTLDASHVDLLLRTKDHVQTLVESAAEGLEMDERLQERHQALMRQLDGIMAGDGGEGLLHRSLRFKESFFQSGVELSALLRFVEDMGEVVARVPVFDLVPDLEAIEPTKCYVGYELQLRAHKSAKEIEEAFSFVEEDLEVHIFDPHDPQAFVRFLKETSTPEESVKAYRRHRLYEEKYLDEVVERVLEELIEGVETPPPPPQPDPIPQEPPKKEERAVEVAPKRFTLRVESSKIDRLINQISEMVIANAKITQLAEELNNPALEESSGVLSSMLEELRNGIMNIRMVQVGGTFNKFRRVVFDIAKKLGKEIEFEIVGAETELDKSVIEKLSDPLIHMLRNSIDHGIETPQERELRGKPRKGRVELRAYPDAGTIVIEVSDDGAGIDRQKVLQKAIAKGIVPEDATLSDKEVAMLIFAPGLSTASEVSDISGRGVGMDVVKKNIEELRGMLSVESEEGRGTKITIRLPLTLAIIDGFLVQVGDTKYIVPLDMIQECLEYTPRMKERMRNKDYIELRDEIIPLLDMRKHFNERIRHDIRENIVVVKYAKSVVGIVVDELFGEFQTVIKPLGEVFRNVPGISGATILGSGEIALIFDIPSLIDHKLRHARVYQ